jgi:hypothetical protein
MTNKNIKLNIVKISLCIFLLLSMCIQSFATNSQSVLYEVGDIVKFGKYEQDNNEGNGKEDIEWKVLDKNGDLYLLISNKILDNMQYSVTYGFITYANSTVRKFLNGTFYNSAFSASEKSKILKIKNKNLPNVKFNIDAGADTEDYAFILSLDEFIKYFGDNDAEYANRNANTIGTEYAYKRGLDVNANNDTWCVGFSPYWLRTPGSYRTSCIYVSSNGGYVLWGDAVNVSYGVRPAIWVQLK